VARVCGRHWDRQRWYRGAVGAAFDGAGARSVVVDHRLKVAKNASHNDCDRGVLITYGRDFHMSLIVSGAVRAAFAPTGTLRAAINLGNPILANAGADGRPVGVSVDLATQFAALLRVELELVVVDGAAKSVDAVAGERADIGFFAIDPARGAAIAFTAPYVLIEGFYLVKHDSPITHNDQVDVVSNRVVVGKGSAYDLYLTRQLTQARIIHAPTSQAVVATFLEQGAEVAAGVKQQLEADAAKSGGLRLLDQRFMVIQQAMGLPKSRGDAATRLLAAFVEDMKATGFVAQCLQHHHIDGAAVAPAA
jgi:polar amino acid transport system substrate-binding protein